MGTVTLNGLATRIRGDLPAEGTRAPDFRLTDGDLQEVELGNYTGWRKVLNIVPSLDTEVCARTTRRFNQMAASLENTVILVISADLPFAQKRFCEVEEIQDIIALSSFRSNFAEDYGLRILDGPFRGLNARAVLVLDEHNRVIYRELVPEIGQEPDYDLALAALGN